MRLEFLKVSQGWTLTHLTYPEVVTPYNINKSQALSQGWTLTHLTYPEVITPYNIDKLQALVSNGPNKHPGARYMSRNRYFSEPICALETISNNKGIHIPGHQVVTGHGPILADAIGMERLGNSLRPCRTCEIKASSSSIEL
ncbi:hypothetical protein V8E54_012891 [Elaphomyces granulatus]